LLSKNLFLIQKLLCFERDDKKMSSCLDLREYQEDPNMASIMGKLLSGRSGYKAVIEKRKDVLKCQKCGKVLEGNEKFCPECGNKLK
jgi:rubrerythrin